jgi:hypothetical protein
MSPRNFKDRVHGNEVVAGIQHAHVAFFAADVDELDSLLVLNHIKREEAHLRIAAAPQQH